MKRALVIAGLVLAMTALPVVVAAPVNAAWSNDPLTLHLEDRQLHDPVGHQTWCGDCVFTDYTTGSPWTVNPGWVESYTPPIIAEAQGNIRDEGCSWDVDDWFEYFTAGGVFQTNTTLVATECRWRTSDVFNSGQILYVRFTSSSPNLVITLTWDWGPSELTYIVPAVPVGGKEWRYNTCVRAPAAPDGVTIPVPGSHDGSGIWEVFTATISNPGSKAGKTGGFFGSDFRDNQLWCPGGPIQL